MGKTRRRALPAGAAEVREGIEHWRKTRKKRAPMPEQLWVAAVELAQTHGINPISQALGVSYDSLKTRLTRTPGGSASRPRRRSKAVKSASKAPTHFVELQATPAAVMAPAPERGVVVEVLDRAGAKLTILLGTEATVDVCAVVTAFRSGSQRGRRR